MGNGFYMPHWFPEQTQWKVHIEIFETKYVLNFLTVFADIMLGKEQTEGWSKI